MRPPDTAPPVIVLGAGIVGICTALSLAERGVAVRVIDRGAPGQETSFGNAGVISPWSIVPQSVPGLWRQIPKLMFGYGKPLSIHPAVLPGMIPWGWQFLRQGTEAKLRAGSEAMAHLCGPCIDLYRRHLVGTGQEDLICDSMYIHAFRRGDRADLQALDYRLRAEKGADMALVDGDELRRLEPALSRDFEAAVVIRGQARARAPDRISAALVEKAQALGVTFLNDDIRELKKLEGGWQVVGAAQTHEAGAIVVCLGVWSAPLLDPLGLRLPLMAERGYHVEVEDPGLRLENSVMDVDAKVVASSMAGGLRIAGQAEFAPIDAPPDPRRRAQLIRLAQAVLPDIRVGQARFWMGRRPSFPDSLPVLGPAPHHEGLYLNFGHSHYGLMMAPKSGELLADWMTGNTPNIAMDAYSATRFAHRAVRA